MKNFLLLTITAIVTFSTSCKKDNKLVPTETYENSGVVQEVKHEFLVDKIYDYHDNLIADYSYDAENKLAKVTAFHPITNRSYQDEFEYSDGRISKIKHTDLTGPLIRYNINLYYNSQGRVFKTETYVNTQPGEFKYYTYYPNGQLKGRANAQGYCEAPFEYNETPNIVLQKYTSYDSFTGEQTEVVKEYEYDDKLKPYFGFDNVPQYEPLPYWGDEALLEKNASFNNMKLIKGGTKYIYEYNEHNLPVKITTKWTSETVEPVVAKIKYKKMQ